MPPFDWQSVAAIALVAWAVVHVARAIRRTLAVRREAKACGGCGTCGADKPATPQNFVPLDVLRPKT